MGKRGKIIKKLRKKKEGERVLRQFSGAEKGVKDLKSKNKWTQQKEDPQKKDFRGAQMKNG